ncbi:MAG: BON domain-containing protein [Bacillota bacterium]
MMSQTTRNTMSLLTGAGLGALAVYLFEPGEGAKRRERIGEAASNATRGAREAIASTWESAREKASQLGETASAGASTASSSLSNAGQKLSEQIGQFSKQARKRMSESLGSLTGSRATVQARQIPERVREMSEDAGGRLRQLFAGRSRRIEARSSVNQTLLAIGCVALGMGIMYVLDPTAGKRRRAFARDKVRSSLGEMSETMQKKSRNVWNRTSGFVSELRHRGGQRQVSDKTLVERIRSDMGHAVSEASAIHVSVQSGRATLSGPIAANEVDSLLKCVWAVPGVVELINRLDVRQPAQAVSDLPGEQTSSTSE